MLSFTIKTKTACLIHTWKRESFQIYLRRKIWAHNILLYLLSFTGADDNGKKTTKQNPFFLYQQVWKRRDEVKSVIGNFHIKLIPSDQYKNIQRVYLSKAQGHNYLWQLRPTTNKNCNLKIANRHFYSILNELESTISEQFQLSDNMYYILICTSKKKVIAKSNRRAQNTDKYWQKIQNLSGDLIILWNGTTSIYQF